MTRKQMALMIGVNVVVSTLVTLLLVLVVLPALNVTAPAVPTATQAVAMAEQTSVPGGQTAPASPTQVIHVVRAGDTVSGLSATYDVPAEDIIAANDLVNPNILQVGMELVIPIGGVVEMTPTFTPMPTPTETPLPFEPPSSQTATAVAEAAALETAAAGSPTSEAPESTPMAGEGEFDVQITEIIGVGQVDREAVVMTNTGTRLADMLGWTLNDEDGNVYTFPNFRLWGSGSSMTIHTRSGQDNNPPANFFWGKLVPVWSPGEVATLKDAEGNAVATFTVGP